MATPQVTKPAMASSPAIPQEKEIPAFNRYFCIPGMLLFGTCTVVLQKFIFNTKIKEIKKDGTEKVYSGERPWFQTEMMFIGMLLCLAVYYIEKLVKHIQRKPKDSESINEGTPLTDAAGDGSAAKESSTGGWRMYVICCLPACCDLVATCIMNIGLVLIPASVWQMLRGSMVIFSAIVSMFLLAKRLFLYQWFGIALVVVGEVIVAVACLLGGKMNKDYDKKHFDASSSDSSAKTSGEMLLGILLTVGAQIVQASQIVIEEKLMKGMDDLPPSLIVGLEGFWGTIICSLMLVIVGYIPKGSAITEKFRENTIETFHVLSISSKMVWLIIFYVAAILAYNLFGMMVTQTFSAVHRTLIEALRTLFIWVANIIIFYSSTSEPNYGKRQGERINAWSALELGGFLVLLVGTFVYNKVFAFPGIGLPTKEEVDAREIARLKELERRQKYGCCSNEGKDEIDAPLMGVSYDQTK